MRRLLSFLLGATVGVLTATVVTYLFGPARNTTFDQHYRSRWDQALADGRQAADEHEAALRQQLAAAKQSTPSQSTTA
ncbi:MAG: hypothetical protein DYG89_20645 [Caldilinea sp. CFX5]|nr:hypothetical protein [Caldilinea sp. CFX5]